MSDGSFEDAPIRDVSSNVTAGEQAKDYDVEDEDDGAHDAQPVGRVRKVV
jgi:hypothetical protein